MNSFWNSSKLASTEMGSLAEVTVEKLAYEIVSRFATMRNGISSWEEIECRDTLETVKTRDLLEAFNYDK